MLLTKHSQTLKGLSFRPEGEILSLKIKLADPMNSGV